MELKINRETVPAAERLYEGIQEQGVELDYILPDYCPDIFRLVKCEVCPAVTDKTVSGDRISYELSCEIHILYCSENSSELQSITQRQCFSKSLETGKNCEDAHITVTAKSEHISCRAVNKRRLDLRGAVSVRITADGEISQEVITDAEGMNIQVRKTPVRFASKRITAEKTVQLSEEAELSSAQPPASGIVNCRCTPSECEKKMISGKLLAKGNIEIKLLYTCEKEGKGCLEAFSFTLPYSQIIDIDGIDDSFDCSVYAEAVSCEVTPSPDRNGENRLLKCEAELKLTCRAVKPDTLMVCTDAYSTVYPCEVRFSEITAEQIPNVFTENFRHNARICEGDSVPQTVYAMWCTPKNINTHTSDGGRKLTISGMLTYTMAACDANGMIVMPDKDEAFEEVIELGSICCGADLKADISSDNVTYNISADGVLTARAELTARISAYSSAAVKAAADITVDDSVRKERDGDYAIKLYYGVENEEIWDIAKRYSTCVDAVAEENDLAGDRLEAGGMLLIPIVT